MREHLASQDPRIDMLPNPIGQAPASPSDVDTMAAIVLQSVYPTIFVSWNSVLEVYQGSIDSTGIVE